MTTASFIVALITLFILAMFGQKAAYRNGIRDGLFNRFLPEVKKIMREAEAEPTHYFRMYLILSSVKRRDEAEFGAYAVFARSEAEAIGQAIKKGLKDHPEAKGYYDHKAQATGVLDDAIKFAAAQLNGADSGQTPVSSDRQDDRQGTQPGAARAA
jgi:hypothetical protein